GLEGQDALPEADLMSGGAGHGAITRGCGGRWRGSVRARGPRAGSGSPEGAHGHPGRRPPGIVDPLPGARSGAHERGCRPVHDRAWPLSGAAGGLKLARHLLELVGDRLDDGIEVFIWRWAGPEMAVFVWRWA